MADQTTLAHLSDLHFGRHIASVVDSLVAELHERSPDLIVVSGDFTQRARSGEFAAAVEFIERLPVEPFVIPGNHDLLAWDLAGRFTAPLRRYKRHISNNLQPAWENEHVSVLGVDTTRRAGFYLDWSRGAISSRRLREVCKHFRQVEESKAKFLVTHHPFAQKTNPTKVRPLITAPRGCLEKLADCGVDAILSGHFHHAHVELLDVPHRRPIKAVLAGTATSDRLKGEPHSFNWITIDPTLPERFAIEVVELNQDQRWAVRSPVVDAAG